ncbi:MAG: hypothetical protein IIA44_01230 [Acidobacteria bacterium]|nr:hypothetical protein [Acidobacteriota bacterium]
MVRALDKETGDQRREILRLSLCELVLDAEPDRYGPGAQTSTPKPPASFNGGHHARR